MPTPPWSRPRRQMNHPRLQIRTRKIPRTWTRNPRQRWRRGTHDKNFGNGPWILRGDNHKVQKTGFKCFVSWARLFLDIFSENLTNTSWKNLELFRKFFEFTIEFFKGFYLRIWLEFSEKFKIWSNLCRNYYSKLKILRSKLVSVCKNFSFSTNFKKTQEKKR